MAGRRFAQLPLERRREILDVAAEEFARSGFEGTSYNKLLERLGIGKGSAYYYFENKRDLFMTVVVECYSSYFETLAERPRPTTAHEFWHFLFDVSVEGYEFILRDPRASAVMRCMQSDPALLAQLSADEVLSSIASFYEDMLLLGQSLGAIRDDLPLELVIGVARSLALTFDQWFVRATAQDGPPDVRETAARYVDLTRRMLSPTA